MTNIESHRRHLDLRTGRTVRGRKGREGKGKRRRNLDEYFASGMFGNEGGDVVDEFIDDDPAVGASIVFGDLIEGKTLQILPVCCRFPPPFQKARERRRRGEGGEEGRTSLQRQESAARPSRPAHASLFFLSQRCQRIKETIK